MSHSWCQNIPRDEAVRAAENNRTGSLPTLEEAIARPFANTQGTCEQSAPAPPFAQPAKCSPGVSETGETQSRLRTERVTERRPPQPGGGANVTGLRTERVTLEITHNCAFPLNEWLLEMVEDVTSDPGESVLVVEEAHFDDLANVALERDAAIRERDALRAERITQALTADRFAAAVAEADTLKARVAELEAAPAASGAAGTEAAGNELPTE